MIAEKHPDQSAPEKMTEPAGIKCAVIGRHRNKSPRVHHRSPEVDAVKIGMIEDGDTNVSFAAKAGMTFGTLAVEMSTSFKSYPGPLEGGKSFRLPPPDLVNAAATRAARALL